MSEPPYWGSQLWEQHIRVKQAQDAVDAEKSKLRSLALSARRSGMTLREVAKHAGVSNVAVHYWERRA